MELYVLSPVSGGKKREAPKEEEKTLWVDARSFSEDDFNEFLEMAEGYAGATRCKVLYGGKRYEFSVNLSRAFLAELRTFVGEEKIKFV